MGEVSRGGGREASHLRHALSLSVSPLPPSPLVRHRAAHGSTGRADGRTRGRRVGRGSRAPFLLSIVLRNKIGEITGAVRRLFLLPVEYLKIDFPSGFPTHTLSVWNLRPEQNRMHNNVSPQHPPLHQTRVRNCTKLSPLDRRGARRFTWFMSSGRGRTPD